MIPAGKPDDVSGSPRGGAGGGEPSWAPTFIGDLPLARRALGYAERLHGDQRRESDEAAFILHPLEVAALLHNTGHPEQVIVAAILHDTLEDTEAVSGEIERRFGGEVSRLVEVLSEDPSLDSYEERKAELRGRIGDSGPPATIVFAADKVAKTRELRSRVGRDASLLGSGDSSVRRRLDHYLESLRMLERVDRGHPLVRQLRFELEALRALPPRGV